LVSIPIITGRLTKAELGSYDLISTGVTLILPVVTLQIHSAAFRFLIGCREREAERREVISSVFAFLLPVSLTALILVFFVLRRVSLGTRVLIVLYYYVDMLLMAAQQVIRGLSKNKLYSLSAIVLSFTNMVLVILMVAVSDQGLQGVLISAIASTALACAILLAKGGVLGDISPRYVSSDMIKNMLRYSWPMIPNRLSYWILNASDRFILRGFLGLESIAVYAAANKIPQLFTSVLGTFVFAWQENASLAVEDGDAGEYYSQMFDQVFCIVTGVMALLIGATPILFTILIKGDYSEAYPQMPILYMGVFFSAIASFLGGIYIAHKKTKSVGSSTIVAAAVNLAIDLLLVRRLEIYAASISTLVSYIVLAVYRMTHVQSFQKLRYRIVKIVVCIAALSVMCVACRLNLPWLNLLNMACGAALAAALNLTLIRCTLKTALSSPRLSALFMRRR
jgi:Membrane protein involved in the export of O-antigen and teichoic acid